MALPNPSMSFSPFAILTAEEMNDIVENIEALADYSAYASNSMPGSILQNSSVLSGKLAESFLRGKYQSNTSNSSPTGQLVQWGWGFTTQTAAGAGGNYPKAVTFPAAYASAPVIITTYNGKRSGSDPTSVGDVTSNHAAPTSVHAYAPTTTGFSAQTLTGTNWTAGDRAVFSWIAIGVPA